MTRSVRPHGGYRGVTEHYPLSINTFNKPGDYIENVNNTVKTQFAEEENERCALPQWVPRYNSDLNHTGEHPLIVQHYLSGNKEEQRNGVLPARVDIEPRLKAASHRHRENRLDYYYGNTTHQYLTATDMPDHSPQVFNIKHGRPTRTSLLRARHRCRSAPGIRAQLEVGHLHKQQPLTEKTEGRCKSVEVPTEDGKRSSVAESSSHFSSVDDQDMSSIQENLPELSFKNRSLNIHTIIINQPQLLTNEELTNDGNCFRDARCLAATGVNVSKSGQGSGNTKDSDTLTSTHLLPSNHSPFRTKQAWENDTFPNKCRPRSRNTNPSTPALVSWSPDTVTSGSPQPEQQPAGTKTIINGSTLHSGHPTIRCQDCIMCRKGVALKGMPGIFSKKIEPVKGTGQGSGDRVDGYAPGVGRERKCKDSESSDHQLVQQYHLKILGVKMGVEGNRPRTPRDSKLHYTSHFTQSRAISASSSRRQWNHNANNNRRSHDVTQSNTNTSQNEEDRSSMPSSKISVRISFENVDNLSETSSRDEHKGLGDYEEQALSKNDDFKNINGAKDGGADEAEERESVSSVAQGSCRRELTTDQNRVECHEQIQNIIGEDVDGYEMTNECKAGKHEREENTSEGFINSSEHCQE